MKLSTSVNPSLTSSAPCGPLFEPVVRRLLRDDNVVDVRLLEARGAYANEACVLLELLYVAAARVAHPRAQAADELRGHVGESALVGDAPLYAFGDEL